MKPKSLSLKSGSLDVTLLSNHSLRGIHQTLETQTPRYDRIDLAKGDILEQGSEDDGAEFSFSDWRIISAGEVIAGSFFFTLLLDFTYSNAAALRKAAREGLFNNQTLMVNHSHEVEDWTGLVEKTWWGKGLGEDDIPGIDARFKIDLMKDRQSGRFLARGIKMGAVHSSSISAKIDFEKSHPKMSDDDFLNKMGTVVDGEKVRMLVTGVTNPREVSLVWQGADPRAKSKKYTAPAESEVAEAQAAALISCAANIPGEEGTMNKEFLAQLAKALGISTELTEENWQTELAAYRADLVKTATSARITELEGDVTRLKADLTARDETIEANSAKVNTLTPLAQAGEAYIKELREETDKYYRLYAECEKKTPDEKVLTNIRECSFEQLQTLHATWRDVAEAKLGKLVKVGGVLTRQSSETKDVKTTKDHTSDGVERRRTNEFAKDLA